MTIFLDKCGKESMKGRRIKTLAIEIFKTINELKPNLMKTILTSKAKARVRPFDLLVYCNTEKHSRKGLMALGPKIWNSLPENVKKKHPLTNSRNMLNRGQVRLANAKFA